MRNFQPRLAGLALPSAFDVAFGVHLSKHYFELRKGISA